MTNPRATLFELAQALAPGSAVSVPREWLLEILADAGEGEAELTVPAVAELFSREPSTVRGWLERGDFPGAYKLAGKEWRVPQAAIAAFRAAQAAKPAEESRAASLGDWRRPPAA